MKNYRVNLQLAHEADKDAACLGMHYATANNPREAAKMALNAHIKQTGNSRVADGETVACKVHEGVSHTNVKGQYKGTFMLVVG